MVNNIHMPQSKATTSLTGVRPCEQLNCAVCLRVPSKSGFTLIELIFAIIIIGISMVSLPMMNQAISKGIEGNLVQEAIFAASAELNQVVSYHWDENSIESINTLAKVISNGDCNTTTKLKSGHINQPLHRRCLDNDAIRPTTTLGLEGAETISNANDIDDAIQATHITIYTDPSDGKSSGYKKDYNSDVNVAYANFGTVVAADKNMKKITVTISDASGNAVTLLNTYSANIGEIDYYKRSY